MFKRYLRHFWQTLFHPRVYGFIIIGSSIIFLTFLTNDNALEIAISGVASVFIGIGVNNFSSLETHQKDEQAMRAKLQHSLKLLAMASTTIENIRTNLAAGNEKQVTTDVNQLENCMILMKQLLKDDAAMN